MSLQKKQSRDLVGVWASLHHHPHAAFQWFVIAKSMDMGPHLHVYHNDSDNRGYHN